MAAVTALGLAAGSAWGLGLGKLTVQSALGETLRAEIDISSMTPDEASSLKLRVAPPESYRSTGLDYNAILTSTQVQLARRADGRPYLKLTSDRAVQEPFVDVILELSWSNGRLVREYTLLFDPPSNGNVARNNEGGASPVISAPAPSTSAQASSPSAASGSRSTASASASPNGSASRPRANAPAPAAAPAPATGASEYTVQPGDTLSRIASRTQPSGVSLDQMLVGLYRNNPDAFISNNMNRLKSGAVLQVPGSESLSSIPPKEARQVIQAQSSDFGGYRQRLAEAAPTLKATDSERQAKGNVQAAVEERKSSAAQAPDKLTLSKPGAATETKVSKETEKKDSATRVAELTRNVEELKKLSAAAKPSAPTTAAAPAPAPTLAPVPAPAPAPIPPVTVAANVPEAASAVASEPASSATAEAAASEPVMAASAPPKPIVVPQPQVQEEPGLLEKLGDYLPAIGAALLVIVGGVAFTRWKAKKDAANRGETAFAESRLAPDSFFGHSGGQRVDTRDGTSTGQSSMSYSLSQLDAIGDVDPVAEADVYLAYGRDLQAEEILKEALRANPERLAIRVKLLEVYGKRRDIKGFEQLAIQLYAETKGQGEDWAKVQELGRQVDPENPLYQPGGAPITLSGDDEDRPEPMNASTLPAAAAGISMGHGADTAIARAAAAAAPRDSGPSSLMDLDLDLDLNTPPPPAPAMAATQALPSSVNQPPMSMDLDLGGVSAPAGPASKQELEFDLGDLGDLDDLGQQGRPAKAAPAPDDSLDFDLSSINLDLPSTGDDKPASRSSANSVPELELPDLSAPARAPSADTMSLDDLGVDLDSIDPNDDEGLQRQLELAEEFRQIGDTEGARDVLQELVAKADGPLRSRAQAMLDQLR
ncbi:FimV/HubP family polar landmark protein [Roseateles amylovorans]|uniref:LysM peptidoglycan-binding domain-containing protein n=1 Tax=Roseateles amylovorans TaxID=2978473 RepID=A0ABY6B5W0_9BURK|nr:FimV/HubP family polar landmark protein [Roseateles amylovorans]UXH80237.1 LysM peptidoglycan-binding domain-containing protein [Roseateles amylovorans]